MTASVDTTQRIIAHVDMDAFFASVEQLEHPEYKGKPVIVGALPGSRGVVSAASYEARTFGVRSAMPISTAYRLCPHGVFLPVRGSVYRDYSHRLDTIFSQITPDVEKVSVDEAFLDLGGCIHLPEQFEDKGRAIKSKIKDALGLTASVGLAPNKFLAKIASDYDKPDGLCVIRSGQEEDFLAPLKVERLWGVGKKTLELLHKRRIYHVSDLQKLSASSLELMFGASFGTHLFLLSHGIDERAVESDEQMPQSIGNERTFKHDVANQTFLHAALTSLAQQVGTRLRKKGLKGYSLTVKVRFSDFKTITRCVSYHEPIDEDHIIAQLSREIFDKVSEGKSIRLLGITLSKLTADGEQLSLFDAGHEKQRALYESLDQIRQKYGDNSVVMGNILQDTNRNT